MFPTHARDRDYVQRGQKFPSNRRKVIIDLKLNWQRFIRRIGSMETCPTELLQVIWMINPNSPGWILPPQLKFPPFFWMVTKVSTLVSLSWKRLPVILNFPKWIERHSVLPFGLKVLSWLTMEQNLNWNVGNVNNIEKLHKMGASFNPTWQCKKKNGALFLLVFKLKAYFGNQFFYIAWSVADLLVFSFACFVIQNSPTRSPYDGGLHQIGNRI